MRLFDFCSEEADVKFDEGTDAVEDIDADVEVGLVEMTEMDVLLSFVDVVKLVTVLLESVSPKDLHLKLVA